MDIKRVSRIAVLAFLCALGARSQVITTFAGTDWFFPTYSLPATTAPLGTLLAVTSDGKGNLYLTDVDNYIVARVSAEGTLSVVAGNGLQGFSGEGGSATSAMMGHPTSVTSDAAGNLYIADFFCGCVRKVSTDGAISSIVGTGTPGFSGDGGPAKSAQLNQPVGLRLDASGNLYIADFGNNRIRKVTPGGVITTIAGTGKADFSGDGGPAVNAALYQPTDIVIDPAGNIFISDTYNFRIRKIAPGGTISTVAGNGFPIFFGDGGQATRAGLYGPTGLALDSSGNLYISDYGSNRVRKVTAGGIISTVAGNGSAAFSGDGGPAIKAGLNSPGGLALDSAGNLYIADSSNFRVRKVAPDGTISTVAGNAAYHFAGDGGPASLAAFNLPSAVALDTAGNLYVADTNNNRIRKVTQDGVVSTVAGNGVYGFSGDGGQAAAAALALPAAVAVDAAGNVYLADTDNNRVRKVTPDGTINTFAGNGSSSSRGDGGPATRAGMCCPQGLAIDAGGNVFISDGNHRVRKVASDGTITTVAGTGTPGFSGDGGLATSAALYGPMGLAFDAAGNLYISDSANNRIRKVTPGGTITTVAGNGKASFSGDGGPAVNAALIAPVGVAFDTSGSLYIADSVNAVVRQVTPDGIISTIAGSGFDNYSGDGGPPTAAGLSPVGLAIDPIGNIFIADDLNNRIREIIPAVSVSTVSLTPSTQTLSFSGVAGGAPPPAQSVSLASSINGFQFAAVALDRWLAVSPVTGSAPATLQVSVDPGSLTAGVYHGTILVLNGAAFVSLQSTEIAVTFTVQPSMPPGLSVNSQNLSFTAVQGSTSQSSQLQVQNSGGGSLAFSVSSTTAKGGNWLSVSPAAGSATPASPVSLTVTAAPGTLAPGTYTGTVSVTGGGTTSNVSVTLSISAPVTRILLSQSGLNFTAAEQGGAPLPQTFGILNVGQGSMDWSASASTISGGDWLKISDRSGTVAQPFLDVSQMNVSIDPAGLSAGDYYGRIQIASSAANSPQSITVILNVLPQGVSPGPEVRPAALIFTGVAGSTPGSQDVMLGNPKSESDTYQSSVIPGPFTYRPLTAEVPPNQPATLRVFPDFSKVQPGTINRGTISLQFADGTPRTISVLTVVAPAGSQGASKLGLAASGCPSANLQVQFRSPSPLGFTATIGKPTTVEVQVVDECGNLITNPKSATMSTTFSNKDHDIALTHVGNGIWTGTWRPVQPASGPVTITVTGFNSPGNGIQSGSRTVSGTLGTGLTPTVTAQGVTQAASFASGIPIAPGSLITLKGSNLADAVAQATTLPLPTEQQGARVFLGNLPVPIQYTSDGQLNVQVPFNTPVNGQYQVTVQHGDTLSVPEQLVIAAAQPGIFTVNAQGTGQGTIFKSDGVTLAQPGTPAGAGETITIYCNGLGAVNPPVPDGAPAPPPPAPPSVAVNPVTVTIGGQNAKVIQSALSTSQPGVHLVTAVVPSGVSGDAVPVIVSAAGQDSPSVTMAVK